MNEPSGHTPIYDRSLLLSEEKRNDLLALWEIQRYGRDSSGDPDYVSLYGLKPAAWYARGIRILARTAVECTRDPLADLMAGDIAAVARSAAASGSVVIDPFAGSGNTLHWIQRRVAARSAIGFELDDAVFEVSRKNLEIVSLDVRLVHEDYETGLKEVRIARDELLIAFLAPPWGNALSEESGLDLRRTNPPVGDIVDVIASTFPEHRLLLATQVHETVDRDSAADVASRFDWSTLRMYDIDPPGRNHGLLLGTRGWSATDEPPVSA